jgi:hypothetical protein
MNSNLVKARKALHKAFLKFKTIPELLERFNVNLIPISLEYPGGLTIFCALVSAVLKTHNLKIITDLTL